jgi:rubrerythrin
MLVEDEQRHERIVRELKANRTAYVEGDWGRLRNVYSELVKSGHELIEESDDLKALLAKAQQMEHEAAQMYQDLADEMQNPQQKELALRLRGEELKHEKLVELTHEYVANPATVLEDSEFLWYGHEGMP